MHGCRTLVLFAALTAPTLHAGQEASPPTVTLESAGQGTPQRLAYKFSPGQFVHYEVAASSKIVMQKGEVQATATNETQTWKQFRVVTVDEQGNGTLEPIITRVKMQAQFNNLPEVSWDSQTGGEPPKDFAPLAQTIGRAHTRIVFAPNGELLKITPLPGAPEHLAHAADKADPKHNFLIMLPKEPVGVGAVWKDRFQTPVSVGNGLTQPITLQRQYTLVGINGSIATIALKTSVITPLNNAEIEGQLIQRTPSGTIEFDIDRGVIVSQASSVNNQVVNAMGPGTRLQAESETREKLAGPTATVQPAALKR
uniref:Uncharacterized protein n=1 Tax=Schlesneria paludicola TaxID=360056 RepID=A0A7C2K2H7_9PLAN